MEEREEKFQADVQDWTLEEHDRIYHKGGYQQGDKCKVRERLAKSDDSDWMLYKAKYDIGNDISDNERGVLSGEKGVVGENSLWATGVKNNMRHPVQMIDDTDREAFEMAYQKAKESGDINFMKAAMRLRKGARNSPYKNYLELNTYMYGNGENEEGMAKAVKAFKEARREIGKRKAKRYLKMVFAEDGAAASRIFVTSDIHTSGMDDLDATGASIVVFAGDVMGGGLESDEAGFRYLEKEFFPWCERNAQRQIVLTAGNHDKFLFRMWKEDRKIDWPKNVHYLIDERDTVDGIVFYGTPWCTKNREGRFEADDKTLAEKFAKIPKGVDVLISHTPPYINGEKIDYADWVGVHEGSKELTEEILKKGPRYCVCGHVHGGSRKAVMLGRTKVMNVARVESDRSKESFKPIVIQVEK